MVNLATRNFSVTALIARSALHKDAWLHVGLVSRTAMSGAALLTEPHECWLAVASKSHLGRHEFLLRVAPKWYTEHVQCLCPQRPRNI